MNCPIDNTQLAITERQGVEIDYCPQCRGVWLDRGELDKIIDRSDGGPQQSGTSYDQDRHHDRPRSDYNNPKKKNRESFLGDLFDF